MLIRIEQIIISNTSRRNIKRELANIKQGMILLIILLKSKTSNITLLLLSVCKFKLLGISS